MSVPPLRTKRVSRPSAKLLDANNAAEPEISAHSHSAPADQDDQPAPIIPPAVQAPTVTGSASLLTATSDKIFESEDPQQPLSLSLRDKEGTSGSTVQSSNTSGALYHASPGVLTDS